MKQIIAFDPGKTTGVVVLTVNAFDPIKKPQWHFLLTAVGQFNIDECTAAVGRYLDLLQPDIEVRVVAEDFRLYPHMAQGQAWSNMPSSQVIGAIRTLCDLRNLPLTLLPASSRKNVTILQHHAPHLRAMPHAREAYRHARYFLYTRCHDWKGAFEDA